MGPNVKQVTWKFWFFLSRHGEVAMQMKQQQNNVNEG